MTLKKQLPGLNLYRALAVILMILAHAARTQTSLPALQSDPSAASVFDWPFLASLKIEPIISAMFLFIAGFSLVLSFAATLEAPRQWLQRLGHRMLTLYGISILFFLAESGPQWPDVLVSSGVLAIIAVGVFSSGLALLTARPVVWLGLLSLAGIGITLILDSQRWSVTGLNAGAGGMTPLLVLAYLGSLTGLCYRRWREQGLVALFGIALAVGLIALALPYPWITEPATRIALYPGDRIDSVLNAFKAIVGAYDGQPRIVVVHYWNHGWIFAFRAMPLLVLGLILFLAGVKRAETPVLKFLDWMGRQALNLYILHLILLALVEVTGLNPASGWQTLLLVAGIVAVSPLLLRYCSFVPFRAGPLPPRRKGADI